MKAEAIPEEFKLSSASTRFSLLLLPFLVLISCKKEKSNSNQALHQKIAGNYKLIKTEVKEGSPVILLQNIPSLKNSYIEVKITSSKLFTIYWPEEELLQPDYPGDSIRVIHLMKPTSYFIQALSNDNQFLLQRSLSNDKYVVQPENISFSSSPKTITCELEKKVFIDGQVHDLKILATYQWSNFPYKFFE